MTLFCGDLFAGGGLASTGLVAAGYTPRWAVETDHAAADAYEANLGPHVIRADVRTVDPRTLAPVSLLWASPPCQMYSGARSKSLPSNGTEDLGLACIPYLEILKPPVFLLENVPGYAGSEPFRAIVAALYRLGYMVNWSNLNAANMGGITRCPLHEHAHSAEMNYPRATALDIVAVAAMMRPDDRARILAWDAAVLVATSIKAGTASGAIWPGYEHAGIKSGHVTPDGRVVASSMTEGISRFALTENTSESIEWWLNACLVDPSWKERWSTTSMEIQQTTIRLISASMHATENTPRSITPYGEMHACPLCKVSAIPQTRNRLILRASLLGLLPPLPAPVPWVGWYAAIEDLIPMLPESAFAPWQKIRLAAHPVFGDFLLMTGNTQMTMPTGTGILEADAPANTVTSAGTQARAFLAQPTADNDRFVCREGDDPSFTVKGGNNLPRAYLVSGTSDCGVRDGADPAHAVVSTVAAKAAMDRVYLVDGTNARDDAHGGITVRDALLPAHAVTANGDKQVHRAQLPGGRVVSMIPRALARFQSVPDSYVLPARRATACKIIGNGVPCLLSQALAAQFVEALGEQSA